MIHHWFLILPPSLFKTEQIEHTRLLTESVIKLTSVNSRIIHVRVLAYILIQVLNLNERCHDVTITSG